MKLVKILSICILVILLFGFLLMQGLDKIEYLRATDEISLRFIEEYEDCVSVMRDFETYYTESLAEYLQSEKYSSYIGNLKKLLDKQAELDLFYNIPFETENEMLKLYLVRELVIMKIYVEILKGKWKDLNMITINNEDIPYSEFRVNEVFNSKYKDSVNSYTLMSVKASVERTPKSLIVEKVEIERRLKGLGVAYILMDVREAPPILPQEFYDDIIKRVFENLEIIGGLSGAAFLFY